MARGLSVAHAVVGIVTGRAGNIGLSVLCAEPFIILLLVLDEPVLRLDHRAVIAGMAPAAQPG